jgi:FkbM family methyltransferase
VSAFGQERDVLKRFLSLLEPDDVVYDIGASIGLYAVTSAAIVTKGKICAFEPDPDICTHLQGNVSLNKFDNFQLMQCALSDMDGEATLYTDGAAGLAPSLSQQTREGAPQGKITVPIRTVDNILSQNELPPPTVLKIDIEGAELLCLKGCSRLLAGEFAKPPRILFIEMHPNFLPDFNSSPEEIKQYMIDCGYELVWHDLRAAEEHLCYQQSFPKLSSPKGIMEK